MSYFTLSISKADVDRRGGKYAPAGPPLKPYTGGRFQLDGAVLRGSRLLVSSDFRAAN